MKNLNVRIPDRLHHELKIESAISSQTVQEIVARAIATEIKRSKQEK